MPPIKYSVREISDKLKNIFFFKNISPGAILKEMDFFSDVNESFLDEIADQVEICEFIKDDIICRHGQFNDRFYILLSGRVKVIIPTEENPRYELSILEKGDFFGEEIIFSSDPRISSILAIVDVMTFAMPGEVLKRLVSVSQFIRILMDQRYIERKLKRDLRSSPLFTPLSDSLFDEVLAKVELITIPQKSIIFNEGDVGDAFYLIREGEATVYREIENEKKIISILKEGQFFGEISLLSDEARNASVEVSCKSELVRIKRDDFLEIAQKDHNLMDELKDVVKERRRRRDDLLRDPSIAIFTRKLLDLNKEINKHLDIITQCSIDTDNGSALLATLPDSRYPYVYPRDSASASRLLYKIVISPLKSSDIAYSILSKVARFILYCQREDGYWGQRYSINGEDHGIYKQEDNAAHGTTILCRYLLAAKHKNISIPNVDKIIEAIKRASEYSLNNYYRSEIHLFYSTTSIHESAIEEGYSIWVNYAYLQMLRLIERIGRSYGVMDKFSIEMELKEGFSATIDNFFSMSGRYVRRLKPNGEIDLRPDITLMSPFYFGSGMDIDYFKKTEEFVNSIKFIEQHLWDPDLGMLQRYLPFIEDDNTHIHAGNGPWLQYTLILAQYYFYSGDGEKGSELLEIVDKYKSKEGYLCEHLTTIDRFKEFQKLEWETGKDFEKEFSPDILTEGLPYDRIVEELNHMKNAYDLIKNMSKDIENNSYITFATPLMWSHVEYAIALMLKLENELSVADFPAVKYTNKQ